MSKFQIFLFANAGGSVIRFNKLISELSPVCEAIPMELPGRGLRADEPFYSDMEELIEDMRKTINEKRDNVPFALLGHSFGGTVAYEIARRMYELGEDTPEALFIFGERPPFLEGRHHYTDLSEEEFIKTVISFGGISDIIVNNKSAMRYFARIIRADMSIAENCEDTLPDDPLPSDIYVFGGNRDITVTYDELTQWRKCTTGKLSMKMFEGDHFFIDDNSAEISSMISNSAFSCLNNIHSVSSR